MSQIKPKYLSLDFENVEACKIPFRMVTDLKLAGIHQTTNMDYSEYSQTITKDTATLVDYVEIELDLDMIRKAKLVTSDDIPVDKRLQQWNDICYVDIIDENDKVYSHYVNWEDIDGGDNNAFQDHYVSNHDPEFAKKFINSKEELEHIKKNPHYKHNLLKIVIADPNR